MVKSTEQVVETEEIVDGRKFPNKAVLVSTGGDLNASPGDCVMVSLIIRNDSNKPWKEGFHIESNYSTALMKQQFNEFKMELDAARTGESIEVDLPILIKDEALTCGQVGINSFTCEFGVTNSNGVKVGQKMCVEIVITDGDEEEQL